LQRCTPEARSRSIRWLSQQPIDFFHPGIHDKAIGLGIFAHAVITALAFAKLLQIFAGDAGALELARDLPSQCGHPCRSTTRLIGVGAGAELGIELIGVRPKFERKAQDL